MEGGLRIFHALCEAGDRVERVRDLLPPAGDGWTALTELLQAIDACVDALVEGWFEWEEP